MFLLRVVLIKGWVCSHHDGMISLRDVTSLPPSIGRSDRYTHDFISDEEDGDDEAFQSPFENYSFTAPRFSMVLGQQQQQLSFDEESESANSANSSMTSEKKAASPRIMVEPKHEKRDSGIAGLEEVKILEPKLSLLSPTDADKKFDSGGSKGVLSQGSKDDDDDDDDNTEEEGEGPVEVGAGPEEDEGGDSTENEEVIITNIDDDLSDEEPSSSGVTTPLSKFVSKPKLLHQLHMMSPPTTPTSPPTTPTRPQFEYPPLSHSTSADHAHSSSFGSRPFSSEHAQSPLSSSFTAPSTSIKHRTRRKDARMEDPSLFMVSHDLDITVSPPTPGEHVVACRTVQWPVGQDGVVQ